MNGRVYDPVLGRFLSPDNYLQLPDFTQSLNRYTYALNNPLFYTDPSGNSFLGSLFGAWFGNYLIGGADRWINKGMSFNDAFFNKNYITASADVTFSPSNFSFSNYQVTQQLIATQTGILSQQLDEVISGFNELRRYFNDGDNWIEKSWNSPMMRFLIPDRIVISLPDINVAVIGGIGRNVEFNWLTRGPDARVLPYVTNTLSRRWGLEGDLGLQISSAWYSGLASDIRKDYIYGPTRDIDGGYIIGGTLFKGLDDCGNTLWYGFGSGFGITVGGSRGIGYTSPGLDDPPRF